MTDSFFIVVPEADSVLPGLRACRADSYASTQGVQKLREMVPPADDSCYGQSAVPQTLTGLLSTVLLEAQAACDELNPVIEGLAFAFPQFSQVDSDGGAALLAP